MKILTTDFNVPSATIVANEFIDRHMIHANGEYVKVFLYILRHSNEEITEEQIADALELTSGDVARAVSYWSRAGLLNVDETVPVEEEPAESKENEGKDAVPEKAPDMANLEGDEEFAELLFSLQKYLSKIFNQSDMETVAYMYDVLKMPRELIEYLVEICVKKGKPSLRYIEAVAQNWHSKGIRTVEDAKSESEFYSTEVWAVLKAFGISDGKPSEDDKKYIATWFRDYGFSREIVNLAIERTLNAIHKPSFQYADSILSSWHQQNVRTTADIEKLDELHKEKSRTYAATGTYGVAKTYTYSESVKQKTEKTQKYASIMREYDALQLRNKNEQIRRTQEVYETVPRIKELDELIRTAALRRYKGFVSSRNAGQIDDFAKELDDIKKEKTDLLIEAGYPADYLDPIYTCKDCQDTGYIGNEKCHCFLERL